MIQNKMLKKPSIERNLTQVLNQSHTYMTDISHTATRLCISGLISVFTHTANNLTLSPVNLTPSA